jgi:pimeloyl-ACP methyl ester carboxylesterase
VSPTNKRSRAADLLGASRLAMDAVAGVTALVEAVHMNVLDRAIGTPLVRPVSGITGFVYRSVKGVTRFVGGGINAVLAPLVPVLGEQQHWQGRDTVLAAVNGVLGDRLAETANPLAIPMALRVAGPASKRIVVLAHGLCMNDRQWLRDGVDHGATLARERGYTPVYLHYNTGRHISENAREFAAQLQALVDGWPVPVEEISIVAHSMGGLVARGAFALAPQWLALLRNLVCLGSPHHGAPLERGGNWINVVAELNAYSAPFAKLARIRSAGITDLRHGSVLDADWQGRDRFAPSMPAPLVPPLPAGVRCFALASTLGKWDSDGLVPKASALGQHADPARCLHFTGSAVIADTGHMALLSSKDVERQLLAWL